MCCAQDDVPTRKVKVTIRSEFKLCLKSILSNNSKTTQANLMKLRRKIKHHGKIEHNESVCLTQELGYHIQGQGHNQVKIVSEQYGVPGGSKAAIRVDPYFKNTGRPVKIRVDP